MLVALQETPATILADLARLTSQQAAIDARDTDR